MDYEQALKFMYKKYSAKIHMPRKLDNIYFKYSLMVDTYNSDGELVTFEPSKGNACAATVRSRMRINRGPFGLNLVLASNLILAAKKWRTQDNFNLLYNMVKRS